MSKVVVSAFGIDQPMFPSDVVTLGARVWRWRRLWWTWQPLATVSIQFDGKLRIAPVPTALVREVVQTTNGTAA